MPFRGQNRVEEVCNLGGRDIDQKDQVCGDFQKYLFIIIVNCLFSVLSLFLKGKFNLACVTLVIKA